MKAPVIEVCQVGKCFGETRALDSVTLAAAAGQVMALLGPNGAGKTTLVRILTTLLVPDRGRPAWRASTSSRTPRGLRSVIGLAGQFAAVDELLTGRENLELVGLWYHLPRREYRRARRGRAGAFRPTTPATVWSRRTPAGCAAAWTSRPA